MGRKVQRTTTLKLPQSVVLEAMEKHFDRYVDKNLFTGMVFNQNDILFYSQSYQCMVDLRQPYADVKLREALPNLTEQIRKIQIMDVTNQWAQIFLFSLRSARDYDLDVYPVDYDSSIVKAIKYTNENKFPLNLVINTPDAFLHYSGCRFKSLTLRIPDLSLDLIPSNFQYTKLLLPMLCPTVEMLNSTTKKFYFVKEIGILFCQDDFLPLKPKKLQDYFAAFKNVFPNLETVICMRGKNDKSPDKLALIDRVEKAGEKNGLSIELSEDSCFICRVTCRQDHNINQY
uniref:Uncharacterized protein n=1 Tax=Panagrolaimus sp. JU765 TaxID=591449 RepID=A0AC34R660_9BILA